MNNMLAGSNRVKFDTLIKALEKRNMEGYFCETKEEACKLVLELIAEDAKNRNLEKPVVGTGGSVTLSETGLDAELSQMDKDGKIQYLSAGICFGDVVTYRLSTLHADTYLMSTNAITMDGVLVNIDGLGNRVAALAFGPRQVIVVAGYNKITPDVDSAVKRVKYTAAAANAIRLDRKTPCGITGKCADCRIPGETLCCTETLTRFGFIKNRIKVILVNEELGF